MHHFLSVCLDQKIIHQKIIHQEILHILESIISRSVKLYHNIECWQVHSRKTLVTLQKIFLHNMLFYQNNSLKNESYLGKYQEQNCDRLSQYRMPVGALLKNIGCTLKIYRLKETECTESSIYFFNSFYPYYDNKIRAHMHGFASVHLSILRPKFRLCQW